VTARHVVEGKGFGLTRDEDDHSVTVDRDTDVIRLVLEDDVTWQMTFDAQFLRLEERGHLIAPTFSSEYWLFRIVRSGQTSLSAHGTSASQSRTFSVTLLISD
jgi:hypothetical protein